MPNTHKCEIIPNVVRCSGFFHIFVVMKRLIEKLKAWFRALTRYVSPVFMMLFVASFVLWYIAKLNYTYTTDMNVKVKIGSHRYDIPCVVEGKGTNLFGYFISSSRRIAVPLEELQWTEVTDVSAVTGVCDVTSPTRRLHIEPQSLQNAIAIRLSDIKIRSIGAVPDVVVPNGED